MGEYAGYNGQSVKIGTCEDMYYLRYDQRHSVQAERGSVDPVKDAGELRFRFPWPDEDDVRPGEFKDYDRKMRVDGVKALEIEHYSVQFKADAGYLVSLPCPEDPVHGDSPHYTIHRNGFRGAVHIVQQRLWEGRLVLVAACGGCGARYRYETLEQVEPVLVAIRSMADRQNQVAEQNNTPGNADIAAEYHEIADRITAGYKVAVAS